MPGVPKMPPPRLLAVSVAVLAALASGCGADAGDDGGPGRTGPTVADARFDGAFLVASVTVDGTDFELRDTAALQIDAEFGDLTVRPGCNVYFGSFTLAADGRASFTVAGGSDQDCGGLTDQEDAVLRALRAAESWAEVTGGFRFDGDGGRHSITILR